MSSATSDSSQLGFLMQQYWQWRVKDSPEFATTLGLHESDDQLEQLSVTAYQTRLQMCQDFREKLHGICKDQLPGEDKLNYTLLEAHLQSFIDGYKWRHYTAINPINFLENTVLNFSSYILDSMLFKSKGNFMSYTQRLRMIPRQLDEQMEGMREAMKAKLTYNGVSMHGAIKQFKDMLDQPASSCDLMKPFQKDLTNIQGGGFRFVSNY